MGPGDYVSDRTEGITQIEDLPAPLVERRSRNYRRRACPRCGRGCYRDNLTISGIASFTTSAAFRATGRATSIGCTPSTAASAVGSTSTPTFPTSLQSVVATRIGSSPWRCASSSRTDCPTEPPPGISGVTIVSSSPIRHDPELDRRPRGKKAGERVETDYLDWALADFSGYLVADELVRRPLLRAIGRGRTQAAPAPLRGARPRPRS